MSDPDSIPPLGATPFPGQGWRFVVWAPAAKELSVHIEGDGDRVVPMQKSDSGYFETTITKVDPGARYFYRFEDGRELPDPASRCQPEGVHGPSQVVDLKDFKWTDSFWRGLELDRSVIYELHVGTYTQQGTFEAVIPHLAALRDLGITTIELMPVAEFPGNRNWGYDGVQPFAAKNSYGGPRGLQKLADAAHAHSLAVALDVVYNHLGPEGNYFNAYGRTSRTSIRRLGERRSITMGRTAIRSGIFSLRTRCTGWRSITSMCCGSTPCMGFLILVHGTFLRSCNKQ